MIMFFQTNGAFPYAWLGTPCFHLLIYSWYSWFTTRGNEGTDPLTYQNGWSFYQTFTTIRAVYFIKKIYNVGHFLKVNGIVTPSIRWTNPMWSLYQISNLYHHTCGSYIFKNPTGKMFRLRPTFKDVLRSLSNNILSLTAPLFTLKLHLKVVFVEEKPFFVVLWAALVWVRFTLPPYFSFKNTTKALGYQFFIFQHKSMWGELFLDPVILRIVLALRGANNKKEKSLT